MNSETVDPMTILGAPLVLPCGATLKNRVIKAAMSDSLGDGAGNATDVQIRLYERWAEGGAALSLIGEVQSDPRFPEKPGNLVLHPNAEMAALRSLAARGAADGTHIWPQLGHAGALAYVPISNPKGPSPLSVEGLRSDGMSSGDIQALTGSFAQGATLAREAGFTGVQIHAGHGFLLSQFLSPLFNHRTDAYGGSVQGRFRVVDEVVAAVRAAVGPEFPIGIKINATDKLEGGLTEDEALEVVRLLAATTLDLIDISGGSYFPGAPSSSDAAHASGPYFIDFARRAKAVTSIPIMLTGGFRTQTEAVAALEDGACDAVGLARALVLDPALAAKWLRGDAPALVFPTFDKPPAGGITAWYSMRLTALSEDAEDRFDMTPAQALKIYDTRDAARCDTWRRTFA